MNVLIAPGATVPYESLTREEQAEIDLQIAFVRDVAESCEFMDEDELEN